MASLFGPSGLATNATAIENNAAAELQYWIEQITTTRPEIDHDGVPAPACVCRPTRHSAKKDIGSRSKVTIWCWRAGPVAASSTLCMRCSKKTSVVAFTRKIPLNCPRERRCRCGRWRGRSCRNCDCAIRSIMWRFDPAWSLRNRTNAPHAAVSEECGRANRLRRIVCTHARRAVAAREVLPRSPRILLL